MDLQTIIKRTDTVISSPFESELVMFDADAGKYYGLNEVATTIWNHLQKPFSINDLCRLLTEEFDISENECVTELLAFLPGLIKRGLVVIV